MRRVIVSLLVVLFSVASLNLGAFAADTLTVTGAGATFPYPIYSKWFNEYHKLHPEIQINYQSIGSGGGIRQVMEGTVDFGNWTVVNTATAANGSVSLNDIVNTAYKFYRVVAR